MLWKWPATAITTPVLTSSILSVLPSSQNLYVTKKPVLGKIQQVHRLHSKLHCTKLQPRWHPCNTFFDGNPFYAVACPHPLLRRLGTSTHDILVPIGLEPALKRKVRHRARERRRNGLRLSAVVR